MYNYNELNAVELSPTKKDYYQIWNELIEVASKLSERWDPSATNESDPGVVLLKVLTAIADKLSYNIDANTLEAFMPSAAQESSMRKLCEMLGYEMRYYQSASTSVRITYKGENFPDNDLILIDQFSNIKDLDSTINYITLEPVRFSPTTTRKVIVNCLEGELVAVQTDLGSVVTLMHLDDNFRFYLPESHIASNGIFINNIGSQEFWEQTTNLNANALSSKVFKFGYDSSRGLPYVQFPEDIGNIINTGLEIRFVRTRGADGNVSVGTLQTMEPPSSWSLNQATQTKDASAEDIIEGSTTLTQDWLDIENYAISNLTAARNGKDPESIDEAYWNYQKTIGTFDTLVTCRDYMNKIYQMTKSDTDNTALVSNIIVSDIRDDINQAYTINSLNAAGTVSPLRKAKPRESGEINHFDLVLYPFKAVYGKNTEDEFNSSFEYTNSQTEEIIQRLAGQKTIAHQMCEPKDSDIACIKVYTKLSARLTTTSKISVLEAAEVEHAAHTALYKNFNLRNLNFGEELPYESILKVLTMADPRIKNVTLDDPKMTVSVCTVNGEEYPIISDHIFESEGEAKKACDFYKRLVLDNVLAGRIPLLHYDTTFASNFTDKPYPKGETDIEFPTFVTTATEVRKINFGRNDNGGPLPPNLEDDLKQETNTTVLGPITTISSDFIVNADPDIITADSPLTLASNEVLQFRAPSFKTTATYPAFVNYFINLDANSPGLDKGQNAIPATMYTLLEFFNGGKTGYTETPSWKAALSWEEKINTMPESLIKAAFTTAETITEGSKEEADANSAYDNAIENYKAIFTYNEDSETYKYKWFSKESGQAIEENTTYYALQINASNYTDFLTWLCGASSDIKYRADITERPDSNSPPPVLTGKQLISNLYYKKNVSSTNTPGYLVDSRGVKYAEQIYYPSTAENILEYLYVPILWVSSTAEHTNLGLGKDGLFRRIKANTEYALGEHDYILISYSTSEGREDGTTVLKNIALGAGTIIKANFELADSRSKSSISRYSKFDNYGPWTLNGKVYRSEDIPGMFACAANEQIEVLEPIKVTLDSDSAYLYWELNPQNRSFADGYEKFPFSELPGGQTAAYTLQEGEYLFFTDENMESAAYYGAGTEIRIPYDEEKQHVNPIKRSKDATKISAEALSEAGALKAIPWVKCNLKHTPLEILEYRLINLTVDDKLKSIQWLSDGSKPVGGCILGKEYRKIYTAAYTINDQDYELPPLALDSADTSWEVRSMFGINMGPSSPQVLHMRTAANGATITRDCISINDDFVMTPLNPNTPMTIYADTPLISITGDLNFEQKTESSGLIVPKAFKICESSQSAASNLAFSADGLAQVDLLQHTAKTESSTPFNTPALELNILIPDEEHFGLLPIHYLPPQRLTEVQRKNHFAGIKLNSADGSTISAGIFNNTDTEDNETNIWWTAKQLPSIENLDSQRLRPGLNMVVIPASCSLALYTSFTALDPTAIPIYTQLEVGKLKLVSHTNMLNYQLAFESHDEGLKTKDNIFYDTTLHFRFIGGATVSSLEVKDAEALTYIRELDPEFQFFYTAEPSKASGLDINELDPTDTMAQPKAWFDKQNVANKFVVAALDSNYLSNYVAVSKYSKIF